MSDSFSAGLRYPELLCIEYQGQPFYGCDQNWYPSSWQRKAGCGPTVAACVLTYLNLAWQPSLNLPYRNDDRDALLAAMQDVWRFIQPSLRGLNSTTKYQRGMSELLWHYRLPLIPRVLDIPRSISRRPDAKQTAAFIAAGLRSDSPVAFLNLSSGSAIDEGLDNWHWVSVVALEEQRDERHETCFRVHFVDEGLRRSFSLNSWLQTTTYGGGFVYLER